MNEFDKFLERFLPELKNKYGFEVVEKKDRENEFYGSSLLLSSNDCEVFLSNERSELSWEMRSSYDPKKSNWYSFDLLANLFGQHGVSGVIDKKAADFLYDHLDELMDKFKPEHWEDTVKLLKKYQRERTRAM